MLELSHACVTWQTTVNRTHRTYTWLTNTESFAEWQQAGAGCTSRAFNLPGHDVTRTWRLAVNLTDYTYDSEPPYEDPKFISEFVSSFYKKIYQSDFMISANTAVYW